MVTFRRKNSCGKERRAWPEAARKRNRPGRRRHERKIKMTQATFTQNPGELEVRITGHAGYAPGGKDIVCVCFSSALSTTYQSAVIAADDLRSEFPEAEIHVVDSLSASLGQGLLLYLAAQQKKAGLTAAELAKWVEENRLSICHWFTVDDLNYLKMGGRVSATTALVGTMLSIKPIMHTSDEGKLVPVSKARGRKAAINALLDKIEALAIRPEEQTMFICHADCELDARAVAQRIKDRFGTKTVYINYIGPVIGSHTGPNTMGIFFVGTQR